MKCILAGLPCSADLAAPAAEAHPVYQNSRFSFSVEVPEVVLQPEGGSDDGNGNGQRFASSSGDATARVRGSHDALSSHPQLCQALYTPEGRQGPL